MLPSITKNFTFRLGIDIDNTIGDFIGKAKEIVAEKTGETQYGLEYLWGTQLPAIKGVSTHKLIFETEFKRILSEMLPFEDAVESALRLHEFYHITYVTFRGPEVRQITYDWLVKHGFPKPGNIYHAEANRKLEAPVQYIIDDHLPTIEQYTRRGRYGILMCKYKYNRIHVTKVKRHAMTMTEAADHLIGLRKK